MYLVRGEVVVQGELEFDLLFAFGTTHDDALATSKYDDMIVQEPGIARASECSSGALVANLVAWTLARMDVGAMVFSRWDGD